MALQQEAQLSDRLSGRRIAWGLCMLTLVLLAAAVSLGHANRIPPAEHALLLVAVTSAAVGALVASRQPANLVGWCFLCGALAFAATGVSDEYAGYGLITDPGSLPAAEVALWLASWLWIPSAVLILVFVPLHFPDGQLVGPRWRPVRWLSVGFCVLVAAVSATTPGEVAGTGLVNPLGNELPEPLAAVVAATILPMWLGLIAVAASSLAVRYRRSATEQRRQIRWLAVGAAVVPAWFLLNSRVEQHLPELFPVLDALALSAVPMAAGLSIVRHRLYDIDVVLNRTLVYAALTCSLTAVYVLVVTQLGLLLRTSDDFPASLVAAGVVAVLFAPLRDRLQRGVNHLMYGERDDPYTVISRLGRRLETALAPHDVLTTVVETVKDALKLPYAAIALGRDGPLAVVAAAGEPVGRARRLPLAYHNELIGELVLGSRPGKGDFTAADRRLLEDLARQAGVAAHTVRLTADLQHARERLVTAQEEERRRLRRDLHDGLGPTLGTLPLTLDVAADLLEENPAAARALLQGMKEKSQTAISDIRRLVYALRPPALDDLGLLGAVREAGAQSGIHGLEVSIEAPEALPDLPAAVEVAAYRIVQEALTNIARHASAGRCTIRMTLEAGVLIVQVEDDGRGITPLGRRGVGIAAMQERAEELGGTCVIESSPAGGTRVHASLPCALLPQHADAVLSGRDQ